MKSIKITYWITTTIIVLFEGVGPALTSNSEIAVEGIRHLQYPDYFRVMLTVFKVAGAIVLIVPFFKGRYKEWAYAGFGVTFYFSRSVAYGCGWIWRSVDISIGCAGTTGGFVLELSEVEC